MSNIIQNKNKGSLDYFSESIQTEENSIAKISEHYLLAINEIDQMNEEIVNFIENNETQQAINLLQKAEKQLDFLANSGRKLDRNLIIIILYNKASVYQSLWELDQCQKFMDGVIFNLENILKEEQIKSQDDQLVRIKRLAFLSKVYLQYCAVLSQLGKHEDSLEFAKKTIKTLNEMFILSYTLCNNQPSSRKTSPVVTKTKYQKTMVAEISYQFLQEGQLVIEEIEFKHLVLKTASQLLKNIQEYVTDDFIPKDEKEQFMSTSTQIYYWKNNPENNEKHIRKHLKVPIQANPNELRSLLGVQNEFEWIEQFNIGTIMHISPIHYSQFALAGELLYEFSKKIILEKILYLSIAYFTIATEMRFLEIDKSKKSQKGQNYQNSEEFKISSIYHLKAIEIACKFVQCTSPYIDHLISSFHKHYNQNLETIMEEQSFNSQVTEHCQKIQPQDSLLESEEKNKKKSKKQQQKDPKELNESEDFNLVQKKLSLESLKLVLQQLQHNIVQKVQSTRNKNQNENAQDKSSKERYSSIKRFDTELSERSQLKSLTLTQLKKLKQGSLINQIIILDLEDKGKKVSEPSNQRFKSLNNLLLMNRGIKRKRNGEQEQQCKTERSAEENRKVRLSKFILMQISKSYAYLYPKTPSQQQHLSKPASFQLSQLISHSSINRANFQNSVTESKTYLDNQDGLNDPKVQNSKKQAYRHSIKTPTQEVQNQILRNQKNKSYINQINFINSNTLNINNKQNFINFNSQDNKLFKSRSNYSNQSNQHQQQQKKGQKGGNVKEQKAKNSDPSKQMNLNVKMETLQALLKKNLKKHQL